MFDDFHAYYEENVVDTYIAYRDTSNDGVAGRSRDLKEAIVAAIALFHLREHLPRAHALSRTIIEKSCPDYALLGDLVNAAKHGSLTYKTPHGVPLVTNASDLRERILIIEYEDEQGIYSFPQKQVLITLADGSARILLDVLTSVLNYWEQTLAAVGVLNTARVFKHDCSPRHRTRKECSSAKLDFKLVQGRRFMQLMQLVRWNPVAGCLEPVDLRGAKAQFRIYRPRFEVEIVIAHQTSGKEFRTTVELTDEEGVVLENLATEEERSAYVSSLPGAKAALRSLARQAGLIGGDAPSAES